MRGSWAPGSPGRHGGPASRPSCQSLPARQLESLTLARGHGALSSVVPQERAAPALHPDGLRARGLQPQSDDRSTASPTADRPLGRTVHVLWLPAVSVVTARACVHGQLWPLGLGATLEGGPGRGEAAPQEHSECSPLASDSLRKGRPGWPPLPTSGSGRTQQGTRQGRFCEESEASVYAQLLEALREAHRGGGGIARVGVAPGKARTLP